MSRQIPASSSSRAAVRGIRESLSFFTGVCYAIEKQSCRGWEEGRKRLGARDIDRGHWGVGVEEFTDGAAVEVQGDMHGALRHGVGQMRLHTQFTAVVANDNLLAFGDAEGGEPSAGLRATCSSRWSLSASASGWRRLRSSCRGCGRRSGGSRALPFAASATGDGLAVGFLRAEPIDVLLGAGVHLAVRRVGV